MFLDHASGLGGAEQSLLLLLKYLNRSRWRLNLACQNQLLAEKAQAIGVVVHHLPMPRLRGSSRWVVDWMVTVRAIVHLSHQIGADVLVANTVRAALYAAPASRLAHKPFIWYARDFWLSESRPRHLWLDRLAKFLLGLSAKRVIANSQATAAHLSCHDKIVVIHNGIEPEKYELQGEGLTFRQRYRIPAHAPLVGMVGRLRPWKGQDRFLRVLAQVRERMPEAWGVIVGGTPLGEGENYPRQLKQLSAILGLKDHLVFTGHLEDVSSALAAMDVFVHPGDPEPFGLVNIEAMASGKPVVAFAHGALPEIVIHGETGLLVPPFNEGAMADSICALLQSPSQQVAMGKAGRRRAQMHFSAQRMCEKVQQVLVQAVS
ncbi:MAG: glycosyltransferase family 4 protein [Thermoflexales bacterium]